MFASEYGWTIPEILETPWGIVEDLIVRIAERYGVSEKKQEQEIKGDEGSAVELFNQIKGLLGDKVVVR